MTFNSYTYAVFLFAVWAAYWLLPHRQQKILLLLASYLCYGFVQPRLVSLLFLVSAIAYSSGEAARCAKSNKGKRTALLLGLVGNFSLLAYFKYADFLLHNVNSLFLAVGAPYNFSLLNIYLPIGISFYVFQSVGFTIDCYRGDIKERTPFLDFLLFISFFPQLVAGPIERTQNIFPQFTSRRFFSKTQQLAGLQLLLWGLFKKVVVADNVSQIVDQIFAVQSPSTLLMLVGTLGFTTQIFADFSAYTDMARGSGKLLGIELMENFHFPYLATSPSEFWKRWHVSLSQWIRDYIYIPLGGSRCSPQRYVANTLLTMFLCGLWHGAAWNFVAWGVFHGLLLILNKFLLFLHSTNRSLAAFAATHTCRYLLLCLTFSATVFGWLLFRVPNLNDLALYFSPAAFSLSGEDLLGSVILLGTILVYSLPLILAGLVSPWIEHRLTRESSRLSYAQIKAFATILAAILLAAPEAGEFIYFQF